VRTANYSVGHRNALHFVPPNELHDLLIDLVVVPHVMAFAEPTLEEGWFFIFRDDDTNGYFRRDLVIRAVERDGRNGISGETAVSLLSKPL
jgi:hypothetical protein